MKKILVPVDFSPATEKVLLLAREMARAFEAELHLLHVRGLTAEPGFSAVPVGYPGMGVAELGLTGGISMPVPAPILEDMPNERETNRLDALREDLTRRGLRAFVQEREGTVVEEILKLADEISADLIVMGSHGHGSVYNLLAGSATEGVLKSGRFPLLLVPAPAAAK